MHPFAPLVGNRLLQLGGRLAAAQRGERRAALVVPQGELAEHSRPPVVRKSRESVVEDSQSVSRPARTKQCRAVLEPQQTIARISLPECHQLLQGVVVSFFAVV